MFTVSAIISTTIPDKRLRLTHSKRNGRAFDAAQPDAGREVITLELEARETDWSIRPGKTVKARAYNGQMPGPVIEGRVGDVLEATNPAQIMGLYPRKSAIQIGADADIAIIHPQATIPVDPKTMEGGADWSPYEGWPLAGFARTTLSRGEVIVDEYKVVGQAGRGQWLQRERAGLRHQDAPRRPDSVKEKRAAITV